MIELKLAMGPGVSLFSSMADICQQLETHFGEKSSAEQLPHLMELTGLIFGSFTGERVPTDRALEIGEELIKLFRERFATGVLLQEQEEGDND